MSLLSLLFTQFENQNLLLMGVSREIFFDATLSERPTFSSQLTTNPIESGSLINDHVIDNPDTLTIDGIISDTKVRILSGVQDIIERGFGSAARSKSAFDLIKQLKEDHTIVTIVSGLTLYTNMIVVGFSPVRTPTTGKALRFTLQLQKLITVNSKVVELEPANLSDVHEDGTDQIQSTTDAGKQATKDAGTAVRRNVSTLRLGLNFLTGST